MDWSLYQERKDGIKGGDGQVLNADSRRSRVVRSGTNLAAIKLAKDMESSDKANEAETYHQDYRGRDLQARRIIGVESKHVAARGSDSATATTAGGGSGG